MIDAIVSGKVYGKPAQRNSKTGAAFTVAKLRVATSASESLFVNVIAFSESAQAALLALDDGDAAALAGTLTPRRSGPTGMATPGPHSTWWPPRC